MKLLALLLAIAALSLGGCYAYSPVGVEAVSPGENVRARLTIEATESLPATVQGEGRSLEGQLLERDDSGLTLFVPTAVRQRGFYSESLHERVRLGTSDVVELERRELDRPRTYLVAGVAATVVGAIAVQVLSGKTGGNTIDRTDQGPAASVLPLFRIRIP